MLSRVAENLYWMSRSIERADNLARLVVAHQDELLDVTSRLSGEHEWHPLLEVTAMGDEGSDENLLSYMVSSHENPDSILNCARQARENGRAVRDQISEEMWLELNALWLDINAIPPTDPNRHRTICERAMGAAFQLEGIVGSTLPRTDIWAFIQLGRYLERADKTSRIIDLPHYLPAGDVASSWNTMLRACSAISDHRQSYGGEVDGANASSLLLFSTSFPRSVRYCVRRVDELLHEISGTVAGEYLNQAERAVGVLLARLNFSGVEEIGELGLHEYIDSIQVDLNAIGWEIMQSYFLRTRHAPPTSARAYVDSQLQAQSNQQQQQQQQQ